MMKGIWNRIEERRGEGEERRGEERRGEEMENRAPAPGRLTEAEAEMQMQLEKGIMEPRMVYRTEYLLEYLLEQKTNLNFIWVREEMSMWDRTQ
jgi:hypothetical protein